MAFRKLSQEEIQEIEQACESAFDWYADNHSSLMGAKCKVHCELSSYGDAYDLWCKFDPFCDSRHYSSLASYFNDELEELGYEPTWEEECDREGDLWLSGYIDDMPE